MPKLDFTRAQTVNNTFYANKIDGNYSPRSKLEELSKSYMAESKVIKQQQVDFNSSVMKLSDNDERLREEVAKALKVQREVFQRKIEMF